MCSIRSVCAALAVFLLSNSSASAGDYSLTYAIDANDRHDAGKIETCVYDKPCEIQPIGFGLSIFLSFIRANHRWVELHIFGEPGCCYSADANRTINLEIKPGLLRVPLYEGRKRRQNEFVRNERFGILYLEFSNLR